MRGHGFIAPSELNQLFAERCAIRTVVLVADVEADAEGWTLVGIDGAASSAVYAAVTPVYAGDNHLIVISPTPAGSKVHPPPNWTV